MIASKNLFLQLVVTVALLLSSRDAVAGLVLISNYEFNGTLSDSLGNSSDFTTIGNPTFNGGSLVFGEPDGLMLSTSLTSGDYRIEIDFSFAQLGRWNKLIDFKNRTLDEGLYINPSNRLNFYFGLGTGIDSVVQNTQYTIGLEKIGGSVSGYLNGNLQFTFNNPTPATALSDTLIFFVDDFATSGEGTVGSVDSIRLYAVPEPSSMLLISLVGGCALIIRARDRKKSIWA